MNFYNKLAKFVSISSLAQIIGFLALPVITRQVSPEEFGVAFFFIATFGLIGGLATFKIEQLYFEENNFNDFVIKRYSEKSLCVFVLLSVAVSLLVILNYDGGRAHGWLLFPLGVFSTAIYINYYFFALKLEMITETAFSKVIVTACQGGGQILLLLITPDYVSLIAGVVSAQIIAALYLKYRIGRKRQGGHDTNKEDFKLPYLKLFYAQTGAGINSFNQTYLPAMFTFVGFSELGGVVAAVQRVLMTPISFIGSAISHIVLMTYAKESLKVWSQIVGMFIVIIFIDALIYLKSEWLGEFILWFLGDGWGNAYNAVQELYIYFSLIFINVIVFQGAVAAALQKEILFVEIFRVAITLTVFSLAFYYGIKEEVVMLSFTVLSVCGLLLGNSLLLYFMKKRMANSGVDS